MRDPNRIGPTLDAIRGFWEQYPDLRLGQLIAVLAAGASIDPFYIEDDALVQAATPDDNPPNATKVNNEQA